MIEIFLQTLINYWDSILMNKLFLSHMVFTQYSTMGEYREYIHVIEST